MLDFRALLLLGGAVLVLVGCRGTSMTSAPPEPGPSSAPPAVVEVVDVVDSEASLAVAPAPVPEVPTPADLPTTTPGQGSSRAEVERVLGAPVASRDDPEGRWHTYRCVAASSGHAPADVVQLGPWTVTGAPAEDAGDAAVEKISVLYDAQTDRTSLVSKVD